MTYKIPGYEDIKIYDNHGIAINHDHKVTLTMIRKNASTYLRSIIDFPDYYNFNSNQQPDEPQEELTIEGMVAMEFCMRDDYVNLIIIREPASRLASSITHDVLTYERVTKLPKQNSILENYNQITRSEIFLSEFSTFDLERYLLQEQPDGEVIPGPEHSFYHSKIQFNHTVTELMQIPNTFVFHLDTDLSANILHFFQAHRPDVYEQYITHWIKNDYETSTGVEASSDLIDHTVNRTIINNRYTNHAEYIYYTILPYLTDPRIRPNKIFDDYQKFYARDIEMYQGMDPDRYFRRPCD